MFPVLPPATIRWVGVVAVTVAGLTLAVGMGGMCSLPTNYGTLS